MHEIRVPRLGWSMEEGAFVRWLKRPGEAVALGEPLYELEGEKALQEIEAVDAGILYVPPDAPPPGGTVAVGALLGYLLSPGEAIPRESAAEVSNQVAPPARRQPDEAAQRTSLPAAVVVPAEIPIATPRAKRVAAELGVDWPTLHGTGRDGRIREADIRAMPAGVLPSRRRAIADRLRISRDRTIPVTLTTTAVATSLVGLRERFKSAQTETIPAYTDIIACVVAQVLTRHPLLAVVWDRDHRFLVPVREDAFHLGIAVDTPDGLLVAVVRNVAGKPLLTVAEESKSLIARAREGRLTSEDMQGGAFTITSLGAFGIDAFTPIINYPEIAILGLGAIRREPVVMPDDRIVPRDRLSLSLTFDHAAVDGAPAAAFLRDVVAVIESPDECSRLSAEP